MQIKVRVMVPLLYYLVSVNCNVKSRNIFIFFAILGICVTIFYMFNSHGANESYIETIAKERKDKDQYMKSADGSPFRNSGKEFTSLKYFQPDPKYRIQANLDYVKQRKTVTLATNTGENRQYLTYAWAEFDLDNLRNRLLILEVMEQGPDRGDLFLAFADETSASETYGGGRYLDVKKVPGTNTITLDFNNAYNPYCAYSEIFSCPIPPPENTLKVNIRAGEKNYK